jgi:hypothetical protein
MAFTLGVVTQSNLVVTWMVDRIWALSLDFIWVALACPGWLYFEFFLCN